MAVIKHLSWAAAFRSSTFRNKDAKIFQGNGIISGGEITRSAGVDTVQPFTFVQSGGIIEVTHQISSVAPSAMEAPYFMVAQVTNMVQNFGETITPTYIKRPQDAAGDFVTLGMWDGKEWILPQKNSIAAGVESGSEALGKTELTGILSGFETILNKTVLPWQLEVNPGSLLTKDLYPFDNSEKTIIEVDELSSLRFEPFHHRIDSVVYRKPVLGIGSGMIEKVTGHVFSHNGVDQFTADSGVEYSEVQVFKTTETAVYFSYKKFGDGHLYLGMTSPDKTISPPFEVQITSVPVTDYCVAFNEVNNALDIFYIVLNKLYYRSVGLNGSVIIPDLVLYTEPVYTIKKPRAVHVKNGSVSFAHVVFKKEISPAESILFYLRTSSLGVVETNISELVSASARLTEHSVLGCNNESLLYVAFFNADNNKVYLRTYDASTSTLGYIPQQTSAPVEINKSMKDMDSLAAIPFAAAKDIKIVKSVLGDLIVAWRQYRGSLKYSVALYHEKFESSFGARAISRDLIDPDENVDAYDICFDNFDRVHVTCATENLYIGRQSFSLSEFLDDVHTSDFGLLYPGEDYAYAWGSNIKKITQRAWQVSSLMAKNGFLFTAYAKISSDGITDDVLATTSSPESFELKRITSSDTLIGHYDAVQRIARFYSNSIAEHKSIETLFQHNNLFVQTGSVHWSAGNIRVLSDIVLHVPGKRKPVLIQTMTDPVSIPSGSYMYIDLDFEENLYTSGSTVLTPVVDTLKVDLTEEIRKRYPLFWNLNGNLYSKFSPFRLDSDSQTIILGSILSEEMKQFIGVSDDSPDPNNHGYLSTHYISQNTSINQAIGILDNAIKSKDTGAKKIDFLDKYNTTLPIGNPVNIDGVDIEAGQTVLFLNLAVDGNRVYKAVGTATTITGWTVVEAFEGESVSPQNGSIVYIRFGNLFAENFLYFNGVAWKNLLSPKFEQDLFDNKTDEPFLFIKKDEIENVIMEYSVKRGSTRKMGMLMICHNGVEVNSEPLDTGIGEHGVTFDAMILGDYLVVTYSTTNIGMNAKLNRSLKLW